MKNKFDNDKGGIEILLTGLLFSLTFSSILIAFLLLQFYGLSVSGVYAPVELPNGGVIDGMQNYKTNQIIDNFNYVNGLGKYVFVSGVGRVLSNNPEGIACNLLLRNVAPSGNVYTVQYQLNNSVKSDFTVYARYFAGVVNVYNIPIQFKHDGIHIKDGISETLDVFTYPYPNINQIDKMNIKTEFNENTGELKVYLDGNYLFTKTGFWKPLSNSGAYYAGVMSKTEGFTVESIDAGSFIVFDSTNILSQIGAFVTVLLKVIVWNVDSQFLPIELNILFIKTQVAGVVVCIIMIIRGN